MPRFTDRELITILGKAARRVNRELCLFNTIDEISVDASGCITPDDGALEDLVLLAAECMVAGADVQKGVSSDGGGIRVIDGEQQIDTRQRALSRLGYHDSEYGPCSEYRRQIVIEKMKRFGQPGAGAGYDIW